MNKSDAAFNDFENHRCQYYDSANGYVSEKINGNANDCSQHENDVEDISDSKILVS